MDDLHRTAVAGQFYPAEPGFLERAITDCYTHRIGPGEVPSAAPRSMTGVAGFVVPHAGYPYSGPVAAHSYHRMAALGKPSVAVVLGPSHVGAGNSLALSAAARWDTPFGPIPVDEELGRRLCDSLPELAIDSNAHASEHSLEVQLPFLYNLFGPTLRLLPIAIADQSLETSERLGRALATNLTSSGAVVLASTDFSHYLPDEEARREDRHALDAITALDTEGLDSVIRSHDLSMCGPGPVIAMMTALHESGASERRLLAYATSGDTSGDYSAVVGYAAIAVEASTGLV